MDPITAITTTPTPQLRVVSPTTVSPVAAVRPSESPSTGAETATVERRRTEQQLRQQVQIEWHATSRAYVHKIVDLHTGETVRQIPSTQVLSLVADVMRKIREAA